MFEEIKEMTKRMEFPLMGTNEDGETVIVEHGSLDGVEFFKTTTAQKNNWCRINYYYANGYSEELYTR